MLLVPEKMEANHRQFSLALEEGRVSDASKLSQKTSPSRAAGILMEGPHEYLYPCLAEMSPKAAGQVVGAMKPDFAAELLGEIDAEASAKLFQHIPVRQGANFLQRLPEETADRLLSRIPPRLKDQLESLARYEEDTAGSVMSLEFVTVHPDKTAGQTLDAFYGMSGAERSQGVLYVVDEKQKLLGVITLGELVGMPKNKPVSEGMNTETVAFHVDDPAVDAAKVLRNRRLMSVPVIDAEQHLCGVIPFEQAMRTLAQNVAEQLAGLGGGTSEESFFTPPLRAIRGRLPWMAGNVFLNLGAVAIISGFEDTIAQVAILAAFLPMITDMGGNVGIQALSVSIRSLALGEVRLRGVWRAVRKEVAIGLVNGLALGALFAAVATVLQGNALIGALAGVALGVNVLVAGVVGGCLPFLIKRLGKDPAMMTGPVLTTITDITGVSIYLGLCTVFLASLL
jgi:magnesium transporter